MPRAMKRDNHKCPGKMQPVDGFPGNCRYIKYPHKHCKIHQEYCVEHNVSYMKNRSCAGCEKARDVKSSLDPGIHLIKDVAPPKKVRRNKHASRIWIDSQKPAQPAATVAKPAR